MNTIRIYRNPACAKCARYARVHRFFDWRRRVEISTAVPPTGPLAMGEVVVQDIRSGRILRGAEALARICREIPAYAPLRLLLRFPAVRRAADRELAGCGGASCGLPRRS